MKLNERQERIFDLICEHKRLSVAVLSKMLYVTEMTIRRDLSEMEGKGYIKRYRGGAVLPADDNGVPVSQRMFIDETEKKALGRKAAELLQDGMTVFIDSSTTSHFLIPYIKKRNDIKIVTNSINALSIASGMQIPCLLIGGDYNAREMCCVGPFSEGIAQHINVDIAFVSTLGITEDGRITDSCVEISAVKEKIMENAKHTVFMFEKSKLNKVGTYTPCRADRENVTVIGV